MILANGSFRLMHCIHPFELYDLNCLEESIEL